MRSGVVPLRSSLMIPEDRPLVAKLKIRDYVDIGGTFKYSVNLETGYLVSLAFLVYL